jgi:hypothetical protein
MVCLGNLCAALQKRAVGQLRQEQPPPTNWVRVNRAVTRTRMRLETINTEEHFQAVGMLCRETLISPAQAVYYAKIHGTLDEVQASSTDAKRMREAYIVEALAGRANNSFESMPEVMDDHLEGRPRADSELAFFEGRIGLAEMAATPAVIVADGGAAGSTANRESSGLTTTPTPSEVPT